MQNPFLNGIVTIFSLIYYLKLCVDIQKDWSIHKKDKNYQGLYIGDIIISIITLPLISIKIFVYIITEIIKGLLDLMDIKIK